MSDVYTPTADAKTDAAHAAATDKNEGARNALSEISQDYQKYAQNHSADDTKKYWQDMTAALQSSGILPDLSVAWADENFDSLAFQNPKYISTGDLNRLPDDLHDDFDKTFAKFLVGDQSTFSQVAAMHTDEAWGQDNANGLSKDDLDAYLNKQGTEIQTANDQAQARDSMQPLLANNGSLFKFLDQSSNGKSDGQISYGDLQRYMNAYNAAPDSGGIFTQANRDYVQKLMDEWNTPGSQTQQLRTVNGLLDDMGDTGPVVGQYLTVDSLAQSGGFTNVTGINDLVAQNATPSDANQASAQPGDQSNQDEINRQNGNHVPTDSEASELKDQLADKDFLAQITDSNGLITKDSLAKAAEALFKAEEHGSDSPFTPEQEQALATLNDSFNVLAAGKGYIDPKDITGDNAGTADVNPGTGDQSKEQLDRQNGNYHPTQAETDQLKAALADQSFLALVTDAQGNITQATVDGALRDYETAVKEGDASPLTPAQLSALETLHDSFNVLANGKDSIAPQDITGQNPQTSTDTQTGTDTKQAGASDTVTYQSGETLYSMVADYLSQKNGQAPSPQDVMNELNKIMVANGYTDAFSDGSVPTDWHHLPRDWNGIRPGQVLTIPSDKHPDQL